MNLDAATKTQVVLLSGNDRAELEVAAQILVAQRFSTTQNLRGCSKSPSSRSDGGEDRSRPSNAEIGLLKQSLNDHPDVLMLANDDERVIKIEVARALTEFFSNFGAEGVRAAVLQRVERLSMQAMNALLKLLEEPPKGAFVVLTTMALKQLAPTLRSRCTLQVLARNPYQRGELSENLSAAMRLLTADGLSRRVEPDEFILAAKAFHDEGVEAAQFLRWYEEALNAKYRIENEDPNGYHKRRRMRRNLLRELKHRVRREGLVVSTQQCAEHLGLVGRDF